MRIHRLYAMILRHFYIFKRSPDRMAEVFYWPLMDMLIWGLTGLYLAKLSHIPGIVAAILGGLIFWTLLFRGQSEISLAVLEELWNKNLINIFTTPLTFLEWITSTLIVAFVKTIMSFIFSSSIAILFYGINIFHYGIYLIPFALLLFMTAWTLGFTITGLILRYNTKMQILAWSLTAVLSPFSGIYYSITTLPFWAQKVALFIPTSYVFTGIRELIQKGTVSSQNFLIPLVINMVYLLLSIWYLRASFKKVLQRGLSKVY